MAKTGRPRWVPPAPEKVEALAASGLTETQIAAALGIAHGTLIEKKREYPEFLQAIKSGQAKGIAKIANALFQKATNGDTTAMIFFLKARAKWSDKPEEENDSARDKARQIRDALKAMDDVEHGDA